ncbi:deoxyhypusine synthase [Tubulinosema ratisbonensis]|uniref:deoxyhypusine synthase n=1 Tax=Tubulinosema ratisbonensis TaxID=291195 RepID=A0A437AII7_9MICR|nr:deoxyhypusine synthase [Tubulinosema ratisbonensis]
MKEIPNNVESLASKKKDDLEFATKVQGLDLEEEITLEKFINSFKTTGFQSTNIHLAIEEVNRMKKTKIFFGCTSNMISSGIREIICHLAKYKHFDVFVTTGGGIEEDLMKTLYDHKLASFDLKGKELRENGFNRVGNLVISNESYFLFEKWFNSFLDELLQDYSEENPLIITPSIFIKKMGEKINNEKSVLYWTAKNNISVYSPALIDGSIGDMLTFYNKRSALKLDIVEDIYRMNKETMFEKNTSAIILGGGLIKHHILNANLFKDGLNHCVLINTANDFDGSDAGANVEEAISWGKIAPVNSAVKVFGDASVIFPLIVLGSYLKNRTRD